MTVPILSLIIWTPLVGVALIVFFTRHEEGARGIALVSTGITLLLSLYLLFNFKPHAGYQFIENVIWIKDLGISYFLGLDGLNLSMVVLVSLLNFLVVLTMDTWKNRSKAFFSCVLIMESSLLGVFLALDLILFYIFWETVLIPGFFLINIWGGNKRERAALKFLIYTMLGSLIMLIAIIAFYYKANLHTFSIPALMTAQIPVGFQKIIFFFLFIGLAIKVPLFPFHSWQPDAYMEAPIMVTVLFSGLLAKMGVYGFIRIAYSLAPQGGSAFGWLICTLAVITIIYANLCAAIQTDLKRMFAYSSLGHMGLIMLGIGALNTSGLEGSIFHMFNHGIIAGAIFLSISMIQETLGSMEIKNLRMIVHYIPTGAMLFWFLLLASFGLPGMSSFIAEVYILIGAFKAKNLFGIIALFGTLIMAGYIFSMLSRISFRVRFPDGDSPSPSGSIQARAYNKKMIFSLISLAVIIIVLGIYPRLLLSRSHNYVINLLTRIQLP